MERELENIYLKHEAGIDKGVVLQVVKDAIVNGRIRCDGVEIAEGETYWTKRCGEYELVIPMPYENERTLVFDMDGRRAIQIEVRRAR